jgi:hypothetical protein
MSESEPCSVAGQVHCSGGATRTRQRCAANVWTETDPCGSEEVCSAAAGSEGACVAVVEVCKGKANASTCDGAGVMYECDPQGVATSMQACASARHCQLGLDAHQRAACLPGEH